MVAPYTVVTAPDVGISDPTESSTCEKGPEWVQVSMIRTVHPIGQGTFITERFICAARDTHDERNINIVYDCGTSTSQSTIENEIKRTFEKGEVIDLLFISHLHDDHINGLKKLLTYCYVKTVFLPILTDVQKISIVLDMGLDGLRLISDPAAYFRNLGAKRVIMVDFGEGGIIDDSAVDISDFPGDSISSGTIVKMSVSPSVYWEYIPFNIADDALRNAIETEYKNSGKTIPDPHNMVFSDIDDAKMIFKKVLGSHKKINANSMVLYSGDGTTEEHRKSAIVIRKLIGYTRDWSDICETGALYLGDFDLKNGGLTKLEDKFRLRKNNIFAIQVPHHGSKANYDPNVTVEFPHAEIYFVCAGEHNSYHHPADSVVDDLLIKGKDFCLVTESMSSMLKITYILI